MHCQSETLDNTQKKNSFNKVLLAPFVLAKIYVGVDAITVSILSFETRCSISASPPV